MKYFIVCIIFIIDMFNPVKKIKNSYQQKLGRGVNRVFEPGLTCPGLVHVTKYQLSFPFLWARLTLLPRALGRPINFTNKLISLKEHREAYMRLWITNKGTTFNDLHVDSSNRKNLQKMNLPTLHIVIYTSYLSISSERKLSRSAFLVRQSTLCHA